MHSYLHNVINNAIETNEPKNIVMSPHDNLFTHMLCKHTPHTYYVLYQLQTTLSPIVNHPRVINITPENLDGCDIDLVICNNIITHLSICSNIANKFHVPMLIVHHDMAPAFVKIEDMQILLETHKYCQRVCIFPEINQSWHADFPVLPYGIEQTEDKCHHQAKAIAIGQFDKNSMIAIQYINQKCKMKVDTIQLDPQHMIEFDKCLELFREYKFFLNANMSNEINILALYAMASGCVTLNSPSTFINRIIKNGQNGYIISSLEHLGHALNQGMMMDIGSQAQKTVTKLFGIEAFTRNWNDLINTLTHTAFRI